MRLQSGLFIFAKNPSLVSILKRNKQLGHISDPLVAVHRTTSPQSSEPLPTRSQTMSVKEYDMFRINHPDFIPVATSFFRDHVSAAEHLERMDMYSRRSQIEIPVFFVGSILAVTSTTPLRFGGIYGEKDQRFVGICIFRGGHGLRHFFILRNVIDGTGVELMYDLYNPCIIDIRILFSRRIQLLKLEKRLDPHLLYLRDAPHEYSKVSMDMAPVKPQLDPKTGFPTAFLNDIKVPLFDKSKWTQKWFYFDLKGVTFPKTLKPSDIEASRRFKKPYLTYDLMEHYRMQVSDEDVQQIAEQFSEMERKHEEGSRTGRLKDGSKSQGNITRRRQLPRNK